MLKNFNSTEMAALYQGSCGSMDGVDGLYRIPSDRPGPSYIQQPFHHGRITRSFDEISPLLSCSPFGRDDEKERLSLHIRLLTCCPGLPTRTAFHARTKTIDQEYTGQRTLRKGKMQARRQTFLPAIAPYVDARSEG